VIGPLITAVGFALFAVPGIGGSFWTTYFPAVVVLGLGMALVIAPLTTTVMGAVPSHRVGVASGINNAVSRTAGLLAIAVLGLVVTAIFSTALDSHLASLHVAPAVRQAVYGQRARLAGIVIPPNAGPAARVAVKRAIDDSFLSGFRVAMLIAAGLALASALVAAIMIPGHAAKAVPAADRVPSERTAQGPAPAV
jgi:hypothetical protein